MGWTFAKTCLHAHQSRLSLEPVLSDHQFLPLLFSPHFFSQDPLLLCFSLTLTLIFPNPNKKPCNPNHGMDIKKTVMWAPKKWGHVLFVPWWLAAAQVINPRFVFCWWKTTWQFESFSLYVKPHLLTFFLHSLRDVTLKISDTVDDGVGCGNVSTFISF